LVCEENTAEELAEMLEQPVEDMERLLRLIAAAEAAQDDEWEELFDEGGGSHYYHNVATGEVCWEKPLELPVDAVTLNPSGAAAKLEHLTRGGSSEEGEVDRGLLDVDAIMMSIPGGAGSSEGGERELDVDDVIMLNPEEVEGGTEGVEAVAVMQNNSLQMNAIHPRILTEMRQGRIRKKSFIKSKSSISKKIGVHAETQLDALVFAPRKRSKNSLAVMCEGEMANPLVRLLASKAYSYELPYRDRSTQEPGGEGSENTDWLGSEIRDARSAALRHLQEDSQSRKAGTRNLLE
jgi:hypothetical protein